MDMIDSKIGLEPLFDLKPRHDGNAQQLRADWKSKETDGQ